MSATVLPIKQRTPDWYASRADWIGSSDAPVIAGESPYKSPLELWAEKTGQKDPDPETDIMATGTLMEPVLRELYRRKTGRTVRRVNRVMAHPDRPWMVASLDGMAAHRIVELKWTHAARWRNLEPGEPVPFDVNLQVQHQLAVTGSAVADVAVLNGPTFDVVEIEPDHDIIANLLVLEADFHEHVRNRTAPEVDGSEGTRRAIIAMHPRETGPLLRADDEWEQLVAELRLAKQRAESWKEQRETFENAARLLIGDATGVEGNGWRMTLTRNADSTKIGWEQVALAYRAMLADKVSVAELETVLSLYTEVKPGPRVLRQKGI